MQRHICRRKAGNKVSVLVPDSPDGSWQTRLGTLIEQPPLRPFGPEVLDFIQHISRSILADKALRRFPELIAVAHWMRRANLKQIQSAGWDAGAVRLARGMALHFAPANVDTIFIYSWFLSVLAGNANVIRLSSRRGDQVDVFLRIVNQTLWTPAFKCMRDRTLIVSYEHDAEMTEEFSRHCQVRVIWGGDETIRRIRAIPLNPLATELVFPDRFSAAVLNSERVAGAGEKDFVDLLHRFYNDAFWFDQMACSSPRLVVWIGPAKHAAAARERFWTGLDAYLKTKGYGQPAATRIRRFTIAHYCASEVEDACISEPPSGLFTRLQLQGMDSRFREMHSGGGLFFEMQLSALREINTILTPKDQTLSVYGFNREELTHFACELPKRCVDRIVPVGEALTFSYLWDGMNLLQAFTREVAITA